MNWKVVLSTGALLLYAGTLYAQCELNLDVPIYDGQTWVNSCDVQVNGVVWPDADCPEVERVHWNWGDGSENDASFPAEHTYSTNGSYVATVTPYDSSGGNVTASLELEVTDCESPPTDGSEVEPEIQFLHDVESQFLALTVRPDALALPRGLSSFTNLFNHYQGVVRLNKVGVPYIVVSKNGGDFGELIFVRMGSRNTNGERLRSNRLQRDQDVDDTDPPLGEMTTVYRLDGSVWPGFKHPGGMQVVGDVLAVALEDPIDENRPNNAIAFIDVSDPDQPELRSTFAIGNEYNFSSGLVGVTPLPDGRYLMLVTGSQGRIVKLYRSVPTEDGGSSDLKSPILTWHLLKSWIEDEIEQCIYPRDWPAGVVFGDAHQMINFVREGSPHGPLYLIGGRRDGQDDFLDLYRIRPETLQDPEECFLAYVDTIWMHSYSTMNGPDSGDFDRAGGVYVSPSGELIVYATEGNPSFYAYMIKAAEWRHREVVQPNSQTLRPSVSASGPFFVDEGALTTLQAIGEGPTTKAWVELFDDTDCLNGFREFTFGRSDESLVIDFEDWNLDNFDDFGKIGFDNEPNCVRYFAPRGCAFRLNDDDFSDSHFPGPNSKAFVGTGETLISSFIGSNIAGEITSMQFSRSASANDLGQHFDLGPDLNCDAYYNAEMQVKWDFDRDGLFEILGETPEFSAEGLDGPSTVTIPVRAEHPTDPTDLRLGVPLDANVHVNNVPPSIDRFVIFDSLGLEIGTEIPVSLVHLEIAAEAYFTDPGKPDTQTASLDWGDGLVEPHTVFDFFTDAFGGVIGQLRHTRIPNVPANHSILLEVMDDDGGIDTSLRSIRVVSASEAIVILIDQIDDLIATATDVQLIAALQQVRNQLIGNNTGIPENGALDKLASGDYQSALVMIEAAIEAIVMAEAVGAGDLSSFKNLLGLTAESVAQELYLEALDLFIAPSKGEAKQILKIEQSIADGHSFLLIGNYPKALDKLQKAVGLTLDSISG